MIELSGQVGELRLSIEITRKETGKTEKYEMVGFIDEKKLADLVEVENERRNIDS
jgi:hypothetical protein